MRYVPLVLAIAILGVGCAPTVEQQRAARLEALQLELDVALASWKTDVNVGRFGTSVDAARALASRYDAVYGRWGLRADALTQAIMAYALAAAVRVDGRDLTAEEANALLGRMRLDVDRARSDLTGRGVEASARRDAAMLSWWKDYWAENAQAFQITPRNPVRCETRSPAADGTSVVCH